MLLSSSCRQFTCKMFEFLHKTPYILGEHHRKIFDALDRVVKGETRKLIINIAPRYGKTEICSKMFIAYGLALNPEAKFLHLSYSGSLVEENSMAVKDILDSEYFKALYPTRIDSGTRTRWKTSAGGGVLATSTLGQITGFGAGTVDKEEGSEEVTDGDIDEYTAFFNPDRFSGAIVIDDPLKPDDALSDLVRESVNRRFETTIRNRVNSRKTPIVIIMQRLHEHDLCGYLQELEPDEWTVLSLPCIEYEEGEAKALWPFKHTLEELGKLRKVNEFVFETQYMQNPTPMEGLLYRPFITYQMLPKDKHSKRACYCDSADTGEDYLCAICYLDRLDGIYVTDVLFTPKPTEYTEPALAHMLEDNDTEYCTVESNNGGRIFQRNVKRIYNEEGYTKCTFIGITQTENKQVRLFTKANDVNNIVYFPHDWERRWPEFANAIKFYRKTGRQAHDDAPDALTGCYERRGKYAINSKKLLKDLV